MKGTQRRIACTLALGLLVTTAVCLAFAGVWRAGLFGMFQFQPRFADTVAILASGEAYRQGLDVYLPAPGDPLGRPHVYGPGWLITGLVGLKVAEAASIGSAVAVVFLAVAVVLLAPSRAGHAVVAALLLCSPPVLLGVSRGNNDLVVFLLLAAAAWLLAQTRTWAVSIGVALLSLAGWLKMYPLICLTTAWLGRGRVRRRIVAIAVASVASGFVFWWWRADYAQALKLAPSPQTTFAYGLPVSVMTYQALAGYSGLFLLCFGLGFASIGVALAARWRELGTSPSEHPFAHSAFMIGATAWCFCFLATKNYPYRFVLLLLPARLWLELAARGNVAARLQLLGWVAVGWLDVAKRSWAPVAAADAQFRTTAWTWYRSIVGVEQGLACALTAVLACSVGIAVFRGVEAGRQSGRLPLKVSP